MARLRLTFVVNNERDRIRGAALSLAAAALFGASAPIAKILLPGSSPFALAGLLYLGAGFGLAATRLVLRTADHIPEARLRLADAPTLGGIVLAGGVIGPVLMLIGLQRLPAITTALLLNLETPFTMLIAVGLFREHLGRREIIGAMLIFLGVVALTYRPGELSGNWVGVAALAGACLSWAVDNNLSQRLSVRDPIAVVRFKALTAGAFSLALAVLVGQPIAQPLRAGAALLLGSVSYGLSLILNMQALRILGAARVAAFFATAPFVGALLAIPLLGERLSWSSGLATVAMLGGVALLVRSRHSHVHSHEAFEHDHAHTHDDHHRHDHRGTGPHSHLHRHEPLTHDHSHASDVHHRHRHQ